MRKGLFVFALSILLVSCKKESGNRIAEKAVSIEYSKEVKRLFSELLIPMEVSNAEATEVTKKYGLEFSGNCYACNAANIIIDGEMLNLMNACDLETQISYKIEKVEETDKLIVIHTTLNQFTFERIDDYPIYKLSVQGQAIDEELYKPVGYYTLKSLLPTFEIHDCGEFDG